MARFYYRLRDASGIRTGHVEWRDLNGARAAISGPGIEIIELRPASGIAQSGVSKVSLAVAPTPVSAAKSPSPSPVWAVGLQEFLQRGRQSLEIAVFYRALATLLGAGIHIVRALEVLAAQTDYGPLNRALQTCARQVSQGKSLSSALAGFPKLFTPLNTNMIQMGEQSGSLHRVLERLAQHAEKTNEVHNQLRAALLYPLFVFALCLLMLALLPAMVFKDLLVFMQGLHVPLPWLTQMLFRLSLFICSPPALLLLMTCLIGLAAILPKLWRRTDVQLAGYSQILQVPALGKVLKFTVGATFSRALASCYSSGIPLVKSLELAARSTENLLLTRALPGVCEQVQNGRALNTSLRETGLFPSLLIQLLKAGEECGTVADSLERAASLCEESLGHSLAIATASLQPIMLALAGLTVGFLVTATMAPMLKVIEGL
jgi:type IV pilus assembly protein PilC